MTKVFHLGEDDDAVVSNKRSLAFCFLLVSVTICTKQTLLEL